jgi:hypothetical protein
MPQKKKTVKKNVKKAVSKPKPPLKNSVNVKIGIDDLHKLTCAGCAAEKKKPKRRKRQPKQSTTDNNNVSYVDESGIPISNEIINKSFNRSYIPQPFSRNSSVIGTTFNESTIMDKVIEKMSKLNNSNQSMNNTVLNQSTAVPAPPQVPRPARAFPPPSTIAPASPSVAPQSLNFNLSSPVRSVGLTPMQASSLAFNRVQQLGMDSGKAAETLQEAIAKLFLGVEDIDQEEIKKASQITVTTQKDYDDIMSVPAGGARASKFKMYFVKEYTGDMFPKDAAELGYGYAKLKLGI